MFKTIILATTLATIAGLSASLPAQAATRSVGITLERFADRCSDQGGLLSTAVPSVSCQTAATQIDCTFLDLNNAVCDWAGIENQIAVNRVIGMPDSQVLNDGSSGEPSVKKGGFKLPKLDFKWK